MSVSTTTDDETPDRDHPAHDPRSCSALISGAESSIADDAYAGYWTAKRCNSTFGFKEYGGRMGGRSALYGFRFQSLRAVESLLKLYVAEPDGDWSIEIESASDEKVDYAERRSGQVTRAVQVKASMPGSATRLRQPEALKILSDLADAYPSADEVTLESNREGTWCAFPNDQLNPSSRGPRQVAAYDDRSLDDLADDVVAMLRAIRSPMGFPSDPRTLRDVAYVLEAMVWESGSRPLSDGSGPTNELGPMEVAGVVRVAGKELAERLGKVPWGQRWAVPTSERIPRREVFTEFEKLLPVTATEVPGRPACAAVTGFSGAGKTSAVASWVDHKQESYAMVLWLQASSEDVLSDSVRQMLAAEHGNAVFEWDLEEVRSEFRHLLGDTPLSWMLVFDDAVSTEVVQRWKPSRGFGHVLITTRNSAWPPSSAASIEISPMRHGAVVELVCRRLGRDPASLSPAENEGIGQLERAADGWPLALDMMIAWLSRTGRSLDQAQEYLARQRTALLGRDFLVPVGYPRTVVSAVLDALIEVEADPAANVWDVLLVCARLGSKSVPVQLVRQLLSSPEADLVIDDAIGELREFSLIRREQIGGQLQAPWADRLFVNDIIGDLAMQLADDDRDADRRAVELLDEVVRDSVDRRDFHLAASMTPLAEAVIEETKAAIEEIRTGRRPISFPVLTLHGNIALVHEARGDLDRAAEILLRETNLAMWGADWALWLAEDEALGLRDHVQATILAVRSLVQLCGIEHRRDRSDMVLNWARLAIDRLEQVAPAVTDSFWLRPGANLFNLLDTVRDRGLADQRDMLTSRLHKIAPLRELTPVEKVERALTVGDHAAAQQLTRRALDTEKDPQIRLDLTGFMAEALAPTDYVQALQWLDSAAIQSEEMGIGPAKVTQLALNVALPLWHSWIDAGLKDVLSNQALRLEQLTRLLSFLPDDELPAGPGNVARLLITRALHAVLMRSPSASAAVAVAVKAAGDTEKQLAYEETRGLQITAQSVQALQLRAASPNVIDARNVWHSEKQVLIAISEEDLDWITVHCPAPTEVTVTTRLWFAAITATDEQSTFTLWIDFSQLASNAFDRVRGLATVFLRSLAVVDLGMGELGVVNLDRLVPIGRAQVLLDPQVRKWLIEYEMWDAIPSSSTPDELDE